MGLVDFERKMKTRLVSENKEPLNSFRCNNNAKIDNPKIFTSDLPSLSDLEKQVFDRLLKHQFSCIVTLLIA